MGVFDNIGQTVEQTFNKSLETVNTATSNTLVTHAPFVRGFMQLCDNGWLQGWHERNGGNLSYRLTEDDIAKARPGFNKIPGEWVDLDFCEPAIGGEFFLTTGAGAYMQNISTTPVENIGIVELNAEGSAYRVVWGLNGRTPTSELPTHLMIHAIRMNATNGACRVIYHAHPVNVIAMTFVEPLEARTFTRALWKAMTECIIVFPEGVGVVPWMVPGGTSIAETSAEQMKTYSALIWAQHGLFASGATFDETFGLMHCIEKAANIYRLARSMNGDSADFLNTISDEGLAQIARELNLAINKDFLDI
jgi:rhamnulose-1-phosphate aldolase